MVNLRAAFVDSVITKRYSEALKLVKLGLVDDHIDLPIRLPARDHEATPLVLASEDGDIDFVYELLLHRANLTAGRSSDGACALHLACQVGHTTMYSCYWILRPIRTASQRKVSRRL